jgi:hypothetical protein
MEGFGAHYAVTLHRPELRPSQINGHGERGLQPRGWWPWRIAPGAVKETATQFTRIARYVRSSDPVAHNGLSGGNSFLLEHARVFEWSQFDVANP